MRSFGTLSIEFHSSERRLRCGSNPPRDLGDQPDRTYEFVIEQAELVEQVRPALMVLIAAVSFVLLIRASL
jgi:hypothetical protein